VVLPDIWNHLFGTAVAIFLGLLAAALVTSLVWSRRAPWQAWLAQNYKVSNPAQIQYFAEWKGGLAFVFFFNSVSLGVLIYYLFYKIGLRREFEWQEWSLVLLLSPLLMIFGDVTQLIAWRTRWRRIDHDTLRTGPINWRVYAVDFFVMMASGCVCLLVFWIALFNLVVQ
jgi:hypothetical protein